jgi:hypothetical protein
MRHRQTFASIALASLALVGLAACGDETTADTDRNEEGEITEEGDVGVFSVQVGDCLNGSATGEVSSFEGVPCDQPHTYEVYHLFDMADGDFDDAAVGTAAEECIGQPFTDYVGLDYQSSEYEVQPLTPTSATWESGDREIVCMLQSADLSDLTGSLEGAAA